MNTDDNKKIIRTFLTESLKAADLQDSDNIFEKGLVNSLFAMQLVMFIENTFNLRVENEELDLINFNSINAMAEFVRVKLNGNQK
jgi:acyl carrier protein